jgi:ribosomal protein S18 acetylase RimI-like enzyme
MCSAASPIVMPPRAAAIKRAQPDRRPDARAAGTYFLFLSLHVMADPLVTALREAATHRGLRLVVSRIRTPGKGDYGKFGLTDPEGKAVFGIGADGLTASSEEVEAFLRRSELETWKRSAASPAPPARAAKRNTPDPLPPPSRPVPSHARARREKGATAAEAEPPKPSPAFKPAPPPPKLRFRKASTADGPAIDTLLGVRGKARGEAAARIAACSKAGGGVLVAERGSIIGCLAYLPVPALHRPPSGRIATLFVAERQRREGIGSALVDQASSLLAKAGCISIEAMSDIEIRSAHGFFRRNGFKETSYRFAKAIEGVRK